MIITIYFLISAVFGLGTWVYMGMNPIERSAGGLVVISIAWPIVLILGLVIGFDYLIKKSFTIFD
jgi:hypothetical protein